MHAICGLFGIALLLAGLSAAAAVCHGDLHAIPALVFCVLLWFWREVDWIADRGWHRGW